jgi:hypothetical protein
MKTTLAILAVALASSALASDKETKDGKESKPSTTTAVKEKGKTEASQKKQEVLLTGSNIKWKVRKDGQITDGPNSLSIIDRKAIERSGAADVRQVLLRQSAFR